MASCCDLSRSSFAHKYVVLCLICGSISSVIGSLIAIIYALIRTNTSSLQYFETIPTYIPAILLISNGLVVICFTQSKTRNEYLIKSIGGLYLVCALLSVIMTVTSTVIHMNRLQSHNECVYTPGIKSCTCITPMVSNGETNVGHHLTFDNTPNCEVIHGLLFGCLRGLFGLSVFAVLICIFSLMLVYQLLSHQKKKKYLQQLELRRRFHIQSRGFVPHSSHPSYVSSHVSPHVLAQNRNHSLRQSPFNSYCEDSVPNGWCLSPHSYDFLNRNFDDDMQSNVGIMTNRSNSWTNWLNWPRNQFWASNNQISNQSTNRRFFDFLRRNHNNRESNDLNQNRWRSPTNHNFIPPHVFIPRIGSGALSPLPPHLTRYRDNHLRRTLLTAMNCSHRRTRSNDGIFQHMNTHNIPIDPSYNPAINGSPNMFALWGPPPPYTCSQPQSLNRINTICNNINHSSVGQHCRESSIHSSDVTPASKMSTPLSERRLRCNAFSSQGIRLRIGAKDNILTNESKSSCIVEIHVPYSEDQQNNGINGLENLRESQKKSNLCFNTMPSMKRNDNSINPFHSLSNIPITFPNVLNSNFTDSELELNKSKLESIENVYRSQVFEQNSSMCSSTPISTSKTTSEMTSNLSTYNNTEQSFSVTSFPVDPPTDYKSTLIIQTPNTQSSPITEKSSNNVAQRHVINGVKEKEERLNSAQSMPNLSCIIPILSSSKSTSTRTQPNFWELHRIPSSGNTSTSQDFADFEFDLDDESIKFATDLPNDCLKPKHNSDSFDSNKSSSETTSITPELIKPPTPFNNQIYSDKSTSSTATLSSLSDSKPELIINIKGIEV